MTEQRPFSYWIGRLEQTTDKLTQREMIVRYERKQGDRNETVEERRDPTPMVQAAADQGRAIVNYLMRQKPGMDDGIRSVSAILRYHRALLPLTRDPGDRARVEAWIEAAKTSLARFR